MNYKEALNANKNVTLADKNFVETYITPLMRKEANDSDLLNALTMFIMEMQRGYGYMGFSPMVCKRFNLTQGKAQQCFDRARYLVGKLDSNYYMKYID
jgi:hypothetical protein